MKSDSHDIRLTADSLKGKQSVRATFKLPAQVIELLSIAAAQLGLKQKSLFDQLVEDTSTLEQIANEAKEYQVIKQHRRQKTLVLSRNSLVALDYVARMHQMPRDVLVEISIKRLMPVLNAEQEKQKKRRLLLSDMERYLGQGITLLHKTEQLLGANDPMCQEIEYMVHQCEKSTAEMRALVARGKIIEDFG